MPPADIKPLTQQVQAPPPAPAPPALAAGPAAPRATAIAAAPTRLLPAGTIAAMHHPPPPPPPPAVDASPGHLLQQSLSAVKNTSLFLTAVCIAIGVPSKQSGGERKTAAEIKEDLMEAYERLRLDLHVVSRVLEALEEIA